MAPETPLPATPLPPAAPGLDVPAETMIAWTELCARYAAEHVASLADQPANDVEGAEEIARELVERAPREGAELEPLLALFARAVPKSFTTPGPGYLAYIPGGGVFPAALADYLAAAVNRYVGMWNAAPALVQLEQTAIDWLRELVGYPEGAAGLLTSGGSLSNFTALFTARREKLGDEFQDGVIYHSAEVHHSVVKAAMLAGFSGRNLRVLPVDGRRRLAPEAVEDIVARDRAAGLSPFLVVASAGTTNTGAVDPIDRVADTCERLGLWLHADAAYGGFFRMLPEGRELVPGLERADSVTLDPHKGLFLPYGTGCLLVRDPDALGRAHRSGADYLQDLRRPAGAVNFAEISPELSRDFRGLRVWLPLKLFGADAFRAQLAEKLALARWAWRELAVTPGFECLDEPQLSVVAFRYRPRGAGAEETDRFNAALLERVNGRKRVFLSSTRLGGRFVLRICVLSFRTGPERVRQAVEDLRESALELAEGT